MRTIIAAVVLLASAVSVEASTCYSIRDYDGRLACLAEERRDPAGCTSIRDWDDRVRRRQRAGERDLFGSRRGDGRTN